MKETIYTQTLRSAAAAEGGTAALASTLHVPEKTLERWMNGRAQTPLRAFLKALECVKLREQSAAAPPAEAHNGEPLTLSSGNLVARCARCDGTEFLPVDPEKRPRYIDEVVCRGCGHKVVLGNIIARLAQDAVHHAHTLTAARERRHAFRVRRKNDVST
jgi:DNA-directed RNA polymerase subunit RPC12/RpoP